jgi:hypothetical protein
MRMTHHHRKTLERREVFLETQQGFVTSLYKGGSEEQVLGRIATQGQLSGEQQAHPLGVRDSGSA